MGGLARRLAVGTLVAALAERGAAQVATPPMVGMWQGTASIEGNWTRAETLPVHLTIGRDDRVTGTIGDATLVGGLLMKNRGEAAETLPWKTELVVDAYLKGPIIGNETVWRSHVRIALDRRDDILVGGLETSAWKVGNLERRAVRASFTLRREPLRVYCDATSTLDTHDDHRRFDNGR